jgi:hypothetical protein
MPCEKFTEAFSHFFIDKYTASLDALIKNIQRVLHFILSKIIKVKANSQPDGLASSSVSEFEDCTTYAVVSTVEPPASQTRNLTLGCSWRSV